MNDAIKSILSDNPVGSLSTVSSDGSPWASPVHFAWDEQNIYWFSDSKAQHSLNISHQPRISFVVWSADLAAGLAGVYLQSLAQVADSQVTKLAQAATRAKFGSLPDFLAAKPVYFAPIGAINTTKSRGHIFYLNSDKTLHIA